MKYYLVGIKGTAMSALALFLQDLGHFVEGSDVSDYYFTEDDLKQRSILIHPFSSSNIDGKSIYIISSAYTENEEVKKIIESEYQYYYFHDFIGTLYYKKIIAVSGTHGKTTTTKMLALFLKNLDVSYIIGSGEGYGSPNSKELVIEACEYKEHFLSFNPYVAIINNIELDHPDYYKNIKDVIRSFNLFAKSAPYLIINGDDENCQKIIHPHKITYGFKPGNMVRAKILEETSKGYKISVEYKEDTYKFDIPWCGKHMIYNFLAAFSYILKFCFVDIINGIQDKINNFIFPKRRDKEYVLNNTILIDDYAHHPTEISALYDAIKQKYVDYKIYVLFQPHTYSRTIKLKKQFIKVLSKFDKVYIAKTFTSKRENYLEKSEKKVNKIFKHFLIFDNTTIETVKKSINNNEKAVWIFLGAGTINNYLKQLITKE